MTDTASARPPGDESDSPLARRLRRETRAEILFDPFSRGRYSTDASIYQITPVGVAVPRDVEDIRLAIQIAADQGVPVLPRGAGTSQCGQAVGEALVIDTSKHLRDVVSLDTPKARSGLSRRLTVRKRSSFRRGD